MITYAHIVTKPGEATKRSSLYQITARSKSYEEARRISEIVYDMFRKYRPSTGGFNFANADEIRSIYDPAFKTHGAAVTLVVIERK